MDGGRAERPRHGRVTFGQGGGGSAAGAPGGWRALTREGMLAGQRGREGILCLGRGSVSC